MLFFIFESILICSTFSINLSFKSFCPQNVDLYDGIFIWLLQNVFVLTNYGFINGLFEVLLFNKLLLLFTFIVFSSQLSNCNLKMKFVICSSWPPPPPILYHNSY